MKKLVLMFAAIAAVSFASCGGNKKAAQEAAAADSARIADSIAQVEAAEAAAAADSAAVDSASVDSAANAQ